VEILSVSNISVGYGPVGALYDVSIEIKGAEVISIVGANGAGKSSLMKAIMGIAKITNGEVIFKEHIHLERLPTHKIVNHRIGYVPEGRRIFPALSVLGNLEMGAFSRKISRKKLMRDIEECFALFPRLRERSSQLGGTLSGGEQQMLAIARGLMCDPQLFLLDEPSMGLAPVVVEEMFRAISQINKARSLPILLVEQNAFMALNISQRCYVLENGRIAISGTSDELRNSDDIRKRYLGA
jgi:branched-chain amino acid transport system ATP-binding protein